MNEYKFDNKLNSLTTILQFLNDRYSSERQQRTLTIPESKEVLNNAPKSQTQIKPTKSFLSTDYPDLDKDIKKIKDAANLVSDKFVSEILISFCRDHSIKAEFIDNNPDFTKKVVNKELPIGLIEQLFKLNSDNSDFISDLEIFIKTKLN